MPCPGEDSESNYSYLILQLQPPENIFNCEQKLFFFKVLRSYYSHFDLHVSSLTPLFIIIKKKSKCTECLARSRVFVDIGRAPL